MTEKYTTDKEDEEIRALYRSGKYSFSRLAAEKNLSKGTIINIVKGYPYTKKEQFYQRVFREMMIKLDEVIDDLQEQRQNADTIHHVMILQQEQFFISIADTNPAKLYERLKAERIGIEQAAWEALSNVNFLDFSLYQSLWDKLTVVIGDNHKNPWGEISDKMGAKSRSKNVRYTINRDLAELKNYSRNSSQNGTDKSFPLSDELWKEIEPYINYKGKKGRSFTTSRKSIAVILEVLTYGHPPNIPKTTLYRTYTYLYRTGIFRLLWELSVRYSELEPVKNKLIELERYRILNQNSPPKLNIKKGRDKPDKIK